MSRTIIAGVVLLGCGLVTVCISYFYQKPRSDVIISDRMSDFIDAIDRINIPHENKLIVFDLDDTAFMSSQIVGTPTWYYNMVNLMRQSGAAKVESYNVVRKIDKIIQERVDVKVIENATISAVNTWQKQGAVVVGLSSRPKDFSTITKNQLMQMSLKFSSPYFACIESGWDHDEGGFIDGVLYIDDNISKGVVFEQFLELIQKCGMDISLLASADDQQRYITEMANIAKDNHTDFVGIIYGGALSRRSFDIIETKKQLISLERHLDTEIVPTPYRDIFLALD